MPTLYANPYNISYTGFYFEDLAEYEKKAEKHPAEEFEIEFIDGDDNALALFNAMRVNQATLEDYFDALYDFSEQDVQALAILMDAMGYNFEDAMNAKDDLVVFGEFDSDKDFAYEFVDSIGSIADAVSNPEYYFDFESFGRDLRISGDLYNMMYDPDDPEKSEAEYEEYYGDMTDQEIGEDFVDSMGDVGDLGKETTENYFDWDMYARDLMFDMSEYNGIYYDPNSV